MSNRFSVGVNLDEALSDIQVLFVDDEVGLSQTVKQILENHGSFTVETASSVNEALKKISKKRFDVIVSDYHMPEKNGLDFLKALRDSGNCVPFILFTGKGREEVAVEALNLGAERYFNKFGDPETVYCELAHGIRQVVSQKRAEQKIWDSEERLRAIIASSPDMLLVSDVNGYLMDCNYEALKLFNASSKNEIIGKNFQELVGQNQQIFENLSQTLMKNGFVKKIETKLLTESGSDFFLEFSANLLRDSSGNIVGGVALARDITEHKQTENALKLSEEKIRAIMRSANDAIILMDPKGNISFWNNAAEKMFGYSKDEVMGKGVHDLLGPKRLHTDYMNEFSNFKVTGKGFPVGLTIEMPAVKKDGTEFPTELSVSAFMLDGKWYAVSIVRDITERKNAEKVLELSEKRFRTFFENSPDYCYIISPEGNILEINKSALDCLGYVKEELVGKSLVSKVYAPSSRAKAKKLFKEWTETGIIENQELEVITSGGEKRTVLLNVHAVADEDGNLLHSVSVQHDITEQKKAAKALFDSEKRFRELSELLPETIYETDAQGVLTYVNNDAFTRFGYDKQDLEDGITTFAMVSPQEREKAKNRFLQLMDGKKTDPIDYVGVRKDGSTFPIIVESVPIMRNNKFVGTRGIVIDITERKIAEEKLKDSLKNLKTLNEKLGVIGKLTRHDARNKLSVILNNIFLAKAHLPKDSNITKHLDDVESAVDLIESIFDFSRFYEKLGEEKLSSIDVKTVIEEAVALHSCSDIITIENECDGLVVIADSLLRQLFYNLIDNSLKHGEKVTKIRAYYQKEKNATKLVYEDDGVGISNLEKQKIFEEGYGKGTGYGLYLIEKLCEVYGWTIQETGVPNEGAQFTITIPKNSELNECT